VPRSSAGLRQLRRVLGSSSLTLSPHPFLSVLLKPRAPPKPLEARAPQSRHRQMLLEGEAQPRQHHCSDSPAASPPRHAGKVHALSFEQRFETRVRSSVLALHALYLDMARWRAAWSIARGGRTLWVLAREEEQRDRLQRNGLLVNVIAKGDWAVALKA